MRGDGAAAREAGLDPMAFEEAMDHRVHRTAVMQDVAEARGLGVRAAPVLFANGTRVEGAEAIRKALRTRPQSRRPLGWNWRRNAWRWTCAARPRGDRRTRPW